MGAPNGKFEVSGNFHSIITFNCFVGFAFCFRHFFFFLTLLYGITSAGAAGKWGGWPADGRRGRGPGAGRSGPRTPELRAARWCGAWIASGRAGLSGRFSRLPLPTLERSESGLGFLETLGFLGRSWQSPAF